MNTGNRPFAVLVIACLYIAVGVIGFVHYFPGLLGKQQGSVWAEVTEVLAVIAGIFLLLGRNWARWLAVAWMAFHVFISYGVIGLFVFHLLLLLGIGWILFRPDSTEYFASH